MHGDRLQCYKRSPGNLQSSIPLAAAGCTAPLHTYIGRHSRVSMLKANESTAPWCRHMMASSVNTWQRHSGAAVEGWHEEAIHIQHGHHRHNCAARDKSFRPRRVGSLAQLCDAPLADVGQPRRSRNDIDARQAFTTLARPTRLFWIESR